MKNANVEKTRKKKHQKQKPYTEVNNYKNELNIWE